MSFLSFALLVGSSGFVGSLICAMDQKKDPRKDRGYETDHDAWIEKEKREILKPWFRFEGVCPCGFVAPLEGDEFKALAAAEVAHFLDDSRYCGGSLVRREMTGHPLREAKRLPSASTTSDGMAVLSPTVRVPIERLHASGLDTKTARAALLALVDRGLTMEEAACRMGASAKLASFPLRSKSPWEGFAPTTSNGGGMPCDD